MLIQEAQWFHDQLALCDPTQMFPMCNVGSSTLHFRTKEQPWIDELIFAPILRQGHVVRHLDIKSVPGVDIVGDLGDPAFLSEVSNMRFKSVFCSNMLEHIVNRKAICSMLVRVISSGGYLCVSVPRSYPYHPDPIDTGFRPSLAELAASFPGTHVIRSAVVGNDTILKLRKRHPAVFAATLFRVLLPFYKPVSWWRTKGYLPWFFRPLTASCVILQKE
jgi:hypothetical protein